MYPVIISIEDVFKGSTIRTVPCAYVTPAFNRLLENLIHFNKKKETEKGYFNVTLDRQNLV